MPEVKITKNGLTVKELKEMIKDWPEEDQYGEPAEVWIEDECGVSNPVRAVWPLNDADILLSIAKE